MSEHVCVGRIKNEPGTKILGVSGLLNDVLNVLTKKTSYYWGLLIQRWNTSFIPQFWFG